MEEDNSIVIPLLKDNTNNIKFYPDELPEDPIDTIDMLRSELPPLKIWKQCAIEYFKRGNDAAFNDILRDILDNESVYKNRPDYTDGITDINIALAAKELHNMIKARSIQHGNNEIYKDSLRKFYEYEKRVIYKLNEYIWLLKGFVQILEGDLKGAEENFRQVSEMATKRQTANRKKYLFGSLIGKGIVDFANQKISSALDCFTKSLTINPSCDASIRTAIAICCYKAGQYDRAKLALKRSCDIEFGDINQLVMLALLELIDAKKDKANRSQSFQQSYELALLAHHFDKSNSSVLNLLANYKFHSWHKLSEETTWELQSMDTIRFGGQLSDRMLGVGDHLRLTIAIQDTEHATLHIIIGANEISVGGVKYLDIQFNPKFQDLDDRYKIRYVECKDFRSVSDFAHKALRNTNNNAIKADSYYILGKLAHTQKNLQLAYDCYQKATELVPDMILANYGAAQIYFAKKEFSKALDLFEKIHHLPRGADDKDTICYISLLKALSRGEYDNFEKLKEIAPGFQFQYDLWLAQGQARFKKPAEYLNAVKCLLEAKRALSEKHIEIPTNLLLNISTLYFNLKDYSNALSYIQLSLTSSPASKTFISSEVNNTGSEIYKLSDFEGVFYEWSEVHIAIKQDENDLNRFQILDSTILPFEIYIGAEILIEDSIWKITQVFSPTEFECCNTFNISISFENYIDLKFRPKVYFSTFSSNNVVTIFNYGRLLEETNMLNAAVCIFENILILHPSHAECCFRLSFIQRACGKFEIAKKYLHKMIAIGEDSVDVHVALGEINVETGALDLAKSNFENAYAKSRRDPQALLAMGNYYYLTYNSTKGDESQLKLCYKFFHPVLHDHVRNCFAANGLGVVCASKREFEAAKDIFSKIKHTAKLSLTSNLENDLNTINILISEHRYVDAEKLLHNLLKTSAKNCVKESYIEQVLESVCFTKFCQSKYEESFKYCLKGLHLNPFHLSSWIQGLLIGDKLHNMHLEKRMNDDHFEKNFHSNSMVQMIRSSLFLRHLKAHPADLSDVGKKLKSMLNKRKSHESENHSSKRVKADEST